MTTLDIADAQSELRGLQVLWQSVQLHESDRSVADWLTAASAMTELQRSVVADGQWVSGPSSIMSVLGIARAEVLNCQVLCWLLDPLARHGLGARMLSSLEAELGVVFGDPNSVRVDAEVSRQNSRADIVISGPEGEIVIEAKIDAGEQPDQGARLEDDWPDADRLVFLTIGRPRIPWTSSEDGARRWQHLAWSWFAETARDGLDEIAGEDTPHPLTTRAREAAAAWLWSVERNLQ